MQWCWQSKPAIHAQNTQAKTCHGNLSVVADLCACMHLSVHLCVCPDSLCVTETWLSFRHLPDGPMIMMLNVRRVLDEFLKFAIGVDKDEACRGRLNSGLLIHTQPRPGTCIT